MNADLLSEVSKVSESLKLIGILLKSMLGAGAVISALIVYIYKTGQKNLVTEIGHTDKKAEVAIDKADELENKMDHEKDRVNRDFMTVQAHKQICEGKH